MLAGTVPAVLPAAGIVTPEAVLLDLDRAELGSRGIARALDVLVQLAALGLMGAVLALVLGAVHAPDWLYAALLILALFVVVFAYHCIFESLTRGKTLGKMALGLRVVTIDGAPIRFRHAALRAMLGLVDFFVPPGGATAICASIASARGQRLGDLVAGTIVLHERDSGGGAHALWFVPPPWLEPLVSRIDTTPLTTAELALVRRFLVRGRELTVAARADLGGALVRRMSARLGVLPPPGVTHDAFLGCVLASYQRRELARRSDAPPPGSPWPWARWQPVLASASSPSGSPVPAAAGGYAAPS
jgi:uncharacterized RDD family membrane protein YckC